MMKVFISADIEGVCGCTAVCETDAGAGAAYAPFARQMTEEVRAACEAALAAGADEVWVKDAHWTGRNIDPSSLPRKGVKLIRGWSGHPYSMMQELDGSFAAAACIGYHSRAGSGGNPLAHTMSSRTFSEIRINDRPFSEFQLSTYTAWREGVPMVFLSGDEALCRESMEFISGLRTVSTMRGIGDSTCSPHPGDVVDAIRSGMEEALRRELRKLPCRLPTRFRAELSFKKAQDAYRASHYPGASLASDHAIVLDSGDFLDVLRLIQFVC